MNHPISLDSLGHWRTAWSLRFGSRSQDARRPAARSRTPMPDNTPRHIRADEAAVVKWMLTHASRIGPLKHLVPSVSTLYVLDRCRCGCCSLEFAKDPDATGYKPIADAIGLTPKGEQIDVLVWGTADGVTALEVIGRSSNAAGLPSLDSLQPAVFC